jgi:hypothetical protein
MIQQKAFAKPLGSENWAFSDPRATRNDITEGLGGSDHASILFRTRKSHTLFRIMSRIRRKTARRILSGPLASVGSSSDQWTRRSAFGHTGHCPLARSQTVITKSNLLAKIDLERLALLL